MKPEERKKAIEDLVQLARSQGIHTRKIPLKGMPNKRELDVKMIKNLCQNPKHSAYLMDISECDEPECVERYKLNMMEEIQDM